MSVPEFLKFQRQLEQLVSTMPEIWVVVANPVHANFERSRVIAVFDTEDMALAYVNAAKLTTPGVQPGDDAENMCGGRISRTFRRDSLLWDCNPHNGGTTEFSSMFRLVANPQFETSDLPVNPSPLPPEMPSPEGTAATEAST